MAETITITEPETGPEAPQEEAQDNQSERPEWLPEKFKTPEDLAKSYSELEKKLSQPSEDEPQQEAEATETEQSPAPQFDKYAEEFASNGELSADSFSELEKMGYPKEMVETYIQRLTSYAVSRCKYSHGIGWWPRRLQRLNRLGTREHGRTNELNVYNQMVESNTDNAKVAVEWLMSRREAAGDVEPNLLSGKSGSPQRDEFRSTAEVVSAMKDPRYHEDPAFRRDVEEKLARSSVF